MKTIVQLTPTGGLKALFRLRIFAIIGQLTVIFLATLGLSLNLPLTPMLFTVALLALWNMAVYWRLRKPWAATHLEIFLNLAVDSTVLTFLLYWAGGASNPFVFIYLVPIAIAAAILPVRQVWAMSLMCVAFYSFLMLFYTPLPPVPERFGGDFNLHVFGMWVNFMLSAVLMAVFVAGLAGAARRKDRSLSLAREEALNNEKIVALGTLAAGVAHEISTPLSTMTVLVDELIDSRRGDEALQPNLELVRKQIDVCKERLKDLLASAGHTRSEGGHAMTLRGFCDRLLDRWRVVRPEIELEVSYKESFQDVTILAEQTLAQSITNLLNNAADASLENGGRRITVVFSSADQRLEILIDDEGKGITQAQIDQAGRAFFSTKGSGFGIGLVLANASLGRLGGEVLLKGAPMQGTRTEIRLPLRDLMINP